MANRIINNKPTKEQVVEFMHNHTNKEAAEHFGVCVNSIVRWLRKWGLSYEHLKYGVDLDLTSNQSDLVVGSLLGDGQINKGNKGKGRFKLGQTIACTEYIEWAHIELAPFSLKTYTDTSGCVAHLDGRLIASHPSRRLYTCAHSIFDMLRSKWYVNRHKIVPQDLELNINILAHWYVQDGHNHQSRRSITLCTDCFSEQEVEFLKDRLLQDLSIQASIQPNGRGQPRIYIGAYEYDKVIEMLKPHIQWKCFQYKVDTSKVPEKTLVNGGASKLSLDKARAIRRLSREGWSRKELAEMFGVLRQSIDNVINSITYPEPHLDVSDVQVIYNPSVDVVLAPSDVGQLAASGTAVDMQ